MRTLLLFLLAVPAHANKVVTEGIPATNNAVFTSTGGTGMSLIGLAVNATTYNGVAPSIGLYVASNVAVGINGCVVYSTGSLTCKGAQFGPGLGSTVSVNASMLGNGSSASPLGVLSSSVPIKNASNFVLNSEVDPSSVAKLGANVNFNSVGIGNTQPSTKLHVSSSPIYVDGTNANILTSSVSINVISSITVINSNTGTAASVGFKASNGVSYLQLNHQGKGYTASNEYIQDGSLVEDISGSGLALAVNTASPIEFWVNGSESARFGTSGLFGLGNNGPAQKLHMSSGTLLIDGNSTLAILVPFSTQKSGFGTANPATLMHLSSGTLTLDGTSPAITFGPGGTIAGAVTVTSSLTATASGNTTYSLQTSSGIKMQNNGCLTFGDASVQCAAAGAGGPTLAANQVWTGTNTFNGEVDLNNEVKVTSTTDVIAGKLNILVGSTFTIGAQSYGSALDYSKNCRGMWCVVASTHSYNTTYSTFTSFNVNYIHRVHYRCGPNSTAQPINLQFGAATMDAGNNYNFQVTCTNGGGGGCGASNTSQSSMQLMPAPSGANANQFSNGWFEIESDTGTFKTVTVTGQNVSNDGTGGTASLKHSEIGNAYAGSSVVTQFQMFNTGKMSCIIYVEALMPGVDPP